MIGRFFDMAMSGRVLLLTLAVWLVGAPGAVAQGTGNLGVQLIQGGAVIALTPADSAEGFRIYNATLRAAPFDIVMPNTLWRPADKKHTVAVAISEDPQFLRLLHVGAESYDTDFLGVGKAMAYDPDNVGNLLTAESEPGSVDGFNALGSHRLVASPDHQTFHVTSIESLITDRSVLEAGKVLTFVVYVDQRKGEPATDKSPPVHPFSDDLIHPEEIDIVRLTFTAP